MFKLFNIFKKNTSSIQDDFFLGMEAMTTVVYSFEYGQELTNAGKLNVLKRAFPKKKGGCIHV